MINVAFLGKHSKNWMGGINYHKNLFFALQSQKTKKINPFVFLGKKADPEILSAFEPYAEIVQDSMFDRMTLKWIVSNVLSHYFNYPLFLNALMEKHNISLISHSNLTYKGIKCKTASWIPDFQHVHLPHMFSEKEIHSRNQSMQAILNNSDSVILSSHDAYNDCLAFDEHCKSKLHVLQFVSQPDPAVFTLKSDFIKNKYPIPEKYFYLPNQMWKHKNHMAVFEAIKNLKNNGIEINLICSGLMSDYRNTDFINEMKSYISDNGLDNNIKLLGLIDYLDVLYFMRYSVAVINPSLFEGWSSTVEECKSMGKNMILSDLDVHKEQNPAGSAFFSLGQPESLEELLTSTWTADTPIPNIALENAAAEMLENRMLQFAQCYESIIEDVIIP